MDLTKIHIEKKYNCTIDENKLEDGVKTIWVAKRDGNYLADGWTLAEIAEKLDEIKKYELDSDYISVERFLEQPERVQKVFKNFCKNSFCLSYFDGTIRFNLFTKIFIPLLTEGQLRKFIEEKTNGVIKIIQWHVEDNEISKRGYSIDILNKDRYKVITQYRNLGEDLLQAYWQVACKIAEEE